MVWAAFGVIAASVVVCGYFLSRYGDVLAEKTGWGRTWIGLVLVAGVTSLPELFSGFGSVVLFDVPDIAVGAVLGSCMFNLLILSLLDVFAGRKPVTSRAHQGHVLAVGFGVLLVGIAGLGLEAPEFFPRFLWFGSSSVLILGAYLIGIRAVFRHGKKTYAGGREAVAEELRYGDVSARRAWILYLVNAVVVIAAATVLPEVTDRIAAQVGLARTFAGNVFVAIVSSLPEVVVTFAALRIGAVDLAFGNLFGSNLFNLAVLAIDDLMYTPGPLLEAADPDHLIAVIAVVLMNAVVVAGITYQLIRKQVILAWDTWAILGIYVATMVMLYARG